MDRLYTARELAKVLQVSAKTIYKLGKEGKIPTYRIGKSVRFEFPSKEIVEDKDK